MSADAARDRARLLRRHLRWFIALRWMAGSLIALAGAAAWLFHPARDPHPALPLALGGLVLAYNAVFLVALRARPSHASLTAQAALQIFLDLVCLVVLTLWTGGAASPLLGAFFFHMFFARLLLPQTWAYGAALAAVAMLALGLRVANLWPHDLRALTTGGGWAAALLVTVLLTDRVVSALERVDAARIRRTLRYRRLVRLLREQRESLVHSERLATLGQLAAGVAHEINNPLSNIDSLLQLLGRRPDTQNPETIAKLRAQAGRIARIVRQLSAYAHKGGGRTQPVQVNDVVRSALDLLGLDQRTRRVSLHLDLTEHPVTVLANPHDLTQVLVNLLSNALDATADVPEPSITIRTRASEGRFVLDVADNGVGIAPDHLNRIFEPFFTTKPVGEGTGLGLSICEKLVRGMGGSIGVSSRVGVGTTFSVSLPVVGGVQVAAAHSQTK